MTIDVDALQMLESEQETATDPCWFSCQYTCDYTG
ncbi:ALQxL family class IV lanthipeptide [Kitasatospora sp. NBC_01266]|nr:ALQxL family class IV lanthipeptide [Kitasatospora sp. NBC_01266]